MSNTVAASSEVMGTVRAIPMFANLSEAEFTRLEQGQKKVFAEGERLAEEGQPATRFILLLDGSVRVFRTIHGSERTLIRTEMAGPIGEYSLLSNREQPVSIQALTEGHLLEFTVTEFWEMMAGSINFRSAMLDLMNRRSRGVQTIDVQQEKMVSLGTLTAGLMHELNNPGTAASRAASQLRVNLRRMHGLGKKFTEKAHNQAQKECMWMLLDQGMNSDLKNCMGSLQQSDAEEELAEWMEARGVEDAWRLSPALVASGIAVGDMGCLEKCFVGESIESPLQWLEAMVSSMQMVATIEESITRVSNLVKAVKSYTHEGQGQAQTIDLNESVYATIMILKHKIMEKQISLKKDFAPKLPLMRCVCSGLNQVWTNVLDNAIDAAPQGGHIGVRTWQENGSLFVAIEDDGGGIPAENLNKIFDPFFTTKPVGVGTGLGLGIAHRIVLEYGGSIDVQSEAGRTEFVTKLPLNGA